MKKTTPFKYQQQSINTIKKDLLKDHFKALFVEMGLGKTLMSLYTSLDLYNDGYIDSVIIISPKALVSTWEQQIKEHIDLKKAKADIYKWEGSQKALSKKYNIEFEMYINRNKLHFFIVNIEAFSAKIKNRFLENEILGRFDKNRTLVLIDESSKIKTHNSNRTKHLIRFGNEYRFRMILTGTEITNTILDIYSQFEFLQFYFWKMKNFFIFRARYAVLEEEYGPGGRTFKKVVGFQRINELMSRIQPHIIRLKKIDCLDLPEKIYQVIELDMPKELRKIYDQLKNDLWTEYKEKELTVNAKVALFTRFRQLCGNYFPQEERQTGHYIEDNPKLDFIIEESEDSEDKFIVWGSFVEEIKKLNEIISKEMETSIFFGEINQNERDKQIEKFRNNGRCLIINPQTGAYGLNLQFCNIVYYYTLPLSPEHYWQSQDRCHRIGQKNKVIYKILLYKDSIDKRIYQLNETKTKVADKFACMSLDDCFDFI